MAAGAAGRIVRTAPLCSRLHIRCDGARCGALQGGFGLLRREDGQARLDAILTRGDKGDCGRVRIRSHLCAEEGLGRRCRQHALARDSERGRQGCACAVRSLPEGAQGALRSRRGSHACIEERSVRELHARGHAVKGWRLRSSPHKLVAQGRQPDRGLQGA